MKNKSEWPAFNNLSLGTDFWPASRGPPVDREKNDPGNVSAVSLTLSTPQ